VRAYLSFQELKFGEDVLKHATGNSKLSDVALVCLLDMCRAATYVKPDGEVPLRMIAFDIAHEIKVCLYNSQLGQLGCKHFSTQVSLSSSHTRKPFWESSDEIDIAMYAEALVAIYRFLSEEDALSLFSVCVEPERSEAVKTCAVRACLTLAEEAGRVKWQKPLDKLEDAMCHRFRNIFKSAGLRRPEIDQYGTMKRAAARPKAARKIPQPLADREVLLLGLLSLWRVHPNFHFKHMGDQEVEEWIVSADRVWDAPIDNSVKMSGTGTFRTITESLFIVPPTDPSYSDLFRFVKFAL
jgi:neurofibromin 1